jgi:predicted phosphate transport protein (TIGR00153 family)
MPRERRFFELFNQHAAEIVLGARELVSLLEQGPDGAAHAAAIDAIEKRADKLTHETMKLLHRTFIVPIDREDIHALITAMDDILDMIRDVSESIGLYDVRRITPEARALADICLRCAERVREAVGKLGDLRESEGVLRMCEEIDKLESDADRQMRAGISKLFREERDALVVIKLKAIYELLEAITDRCEDVANILEGIVLENA